MPRIAGVDLPRNKRVEIALTNIYGIGRSRSNEILNSVGVDKGKRVHELTEKEITDLRKKIDQYMVEGDLRRKVKSDIDRLKDIECYRGIRHQRGLPVRGQKTQSNARTWKGPRASKAGKKR